MKKTKRIIKINKTKIVNKIADDVILNVNESSADELVMYGLCLKFFAEFNTFKLIADVLLLILGSAFAYCFSNVYFISLSLLFCFINIRCFFKHLDERIYYNKLFETLATGLHIVHDVSIQNIREIVSDISMEDFMKFLEEQECATIKIK